MLLLYSAGIVVVVIQPGHTAVMVVAAAHVGDDEVTGVVTSAGRRIEGGEGAGATW